MNQFYLSYLVWILRTVYRLKLIYNAAYFTFHTCLLLFNTLPNYHSEAASSFHVVGVLFQFLGRVQKFSFDIWYIFGEVYDHSTEL